jgi:hypothetical protein
VGTFGFEKLTSSKSNAVKGIRCFAHSYDPGQVEDMFLSIVYPV